MAGSLVVHPDFEEFRQELQLAVDDFSKNPNLIAGGGRNSIKTAEIGQHRLNLKGFKVPGLLQSLVYRFLRKSKARRSFEYALKLKSLDIGTPQPVAYYENHSTGLKDSFYISEHLDFDFEFRVLNHNPHYPDRKKILQQMAEFTFQMHEKGVNFLDHSPGNTLIKKRPDGHYDFYLIDLNRMRFEDLSFEQRMKNFRRLWLSKTMINIMAPVYAGLSGHSEEETHRLMTKYSRSFQKKVNSKKLRRRRRRA